VSKEITNRLLDMDPYEFESLIAELVRRMGYTVKLTKKSRDGGVDVNASLLTPLGEIETIIQVKRYRNPLGVAVVRELYGVIASRKGASAVIITTSKFTKGAEEFARENNIKLIDGMELARLLVEHGLEDSLKAPEEVLEKYAKKILCFMNKEEVMKVFEKHRGRRGFFGGQEEKIERVDISLAPVGKFRVSWIDEVVEGIFSRKTKFVSSQGSIFIDLADGALLYTLRLDRGWRLEIHPPTGPPLIKTLNELSRDEIETFSLIARSVRYHLARGKTYPLLTIEKMNRRHISKLANLGLISVDSRRGGILMDPIIAHPYGFSKMIENRLRRPAREELDQVYEFSSIKEEEGATVPIEISGETVKRIFAEAYDVEAELEEVFYIPTYLCKYVDEEGKYRLLAMGPPTALFLKTSGWVPLEPVEYPVLDERYMI